MLRHSHHNLLGALISRHGSKNWKGKRVVDVRSTIESELHARTISWAWASGTGDRCWYRCCGNWSWTKVQAKPWGGPGCLHWLQQLFSLLLDLGKMWATALIIARLIDNIDLNPFHPLISVLLTSLKHFATLSSTTMTLLVLPLLSVTICLLGSTNHSPSTTNLYVDAQ